MGANRSSASWQYYEAEQEGSSETYPVSWAAAEYPPLQGPPPRQGAPVQNGSFYSQGPSSALANDMYLAPHERGQVTTAQGGGNGAYLVQAPLTSPQGQGGVAPQDLSRTQAMPFSSVASLPTLLIFDWDDTLMCSTAINANQLQPHQAQQLEVLLEQVLTLSLRLGEPIIVTNADELWVLESSRRFTPRVLQLLQQISVISARRKYELQCPGDVFAWKRETFREVLQARQARPATCSGLNLIVLGDSPSEMEAAQTATLGLTMPMVIKTVKFKEQPTCEELLEQLRIIVQDLATIVADERSSCRNLVQWMRPAMSPALAQVPPQPVGYSQVSAGGVVATYYAAEAAQTFAYSPPVLPTPYVTTTAGAYMGTPMIYAAGH